MPERDFFTSYDDIPPLVVRTLFYLENRRLGNLSSRANPALDWGRLAKAGISYTARAIGFPTRLEGGSTLAVQMQKYSHSPSGRTSSGLDKLRQIVSATLAAYRNGPDTQSASRQVVLDYVNSIPLGAVTGVGEVHGLRSGLRNWFGLDPDRVCEALRGEHSKAEQVRASTRYAPVCCAPSRYLRHEAPRSRRGSTMPSHRWRMPACSSPRSRTASAMRA